MTDNASLAILPPRNSIISSRAFTKPCRKPVFCSGQTPTLLRVNSHFAPGKLPACLVASVERSFSFIVIVRLSLFIIFISRRNIMFVVILCLYFDSNSLFSSSLLGNTVWYLLANIWLLSLGSVISTTASLLSRQSSIPIVGFSSSNFT